MNRSRVSDEMLEGAFTTYGADEDLAVATLLQCSTEIHLVLQAMEHGCADYMVQATLMCIAQRMEVAARLASEPPESITTDDVVEKGRPAAQCTPRAENSHERVHRGGARA